MSLDQFQLKAAMRKWASGVTVVTVNDQGIDHGMTVSSFTSVSLEPPLITVSLMKQTRSLTMIINSKTFGITILSDQQKEISDVFAGQVEDTQDRFSGIQTKRLTTGSPMIEGGLAFFDCRVFDVLRFGTNSLIIGEVIAAEISEHVKPLLYFNQRYQQLQD